MRHCKQTVFLILLMLVLLLPLASAEGRTFITVDGCVPLEIREGSAVTAEEIIVPKSGNTINPQFGDQIHPSLTNGDTVVQGDISSLRVLLLLEDADGNKYLQAAVWDADSATYAITRSSNRKMRIWTPITRGMLSFCQLDTTRRDLPNRVIWTTLRGCTSRRNGRTRARGS